MSEEKKQQVVALGRFGWTLRRIEEATGVRRETASGYLKAAGVAVRAPRTRRPPTTDEGRPDAAPVAGAESNPASREEVSTDSTSAPAHRPPPQRSPKSSACEPYREVIELALGRGRNAMAVWQELVDEHDFAGRYASVRRFVRRLRGQPSDQEARAIITTPPGQEAQVDYGTGPMVRGGPTGKYRRTRLFVLTLGHSRKCVRRLVFKSSARVWCELHEDAFRCLGGAPRVLVLDNLKEGVLAPDFYDPALNPLYRDVLKHYGAVALPCRVRDPDRKGKVESGVGHAKRTPLKGLRFQSLDEAQAYLDRWEARWADTRIHGTTQRQVAAMFTEERPHLLPLPVEPFRYYEYGIRTVHLDGCIEVQGAYYGAPPGRIGQTVHAQWDGRVVRILDPENGQLLREHLRQEPGGFRRAPADEPKRTPKTTTQLLARAAHAGRHIGALCAEIHRLDGELGVRRVLGVLALVKRYGPAAVDNAAAAAFEVGVPSYRFVRRYLERGPQLQLSLRQVDPLIRQLTEYRDLIQRIANKEEPSP